MKAEKAERVERTVIPSAARDPYLDAGLKISRKGAKTWREIGSHTEIKEITERRPDDPGDSASL